MARIKPDDIVLELNREFRRSLEDAVSEVIPDAKFDPDELFRAFERALRRRCGTWEGVPDHFVKKY